MTLAWHPGERRLNSYCLLRYDPPVAELQKRLELARRALGHDAMNLLRHGRGAPLWCERIWLDPPTCRDSYGRFKASNSGDIIGGDWDQKTYPFDRNPIAAACLRHWRDGMSWEESGAYELQLERIKRHGIRNADGCRTLEDVIGRYEQLDEIFLTAKREGRLRPRNETDGYTFRERDGILIHIARDCRPIFGQRGVHRFVMAQLLGLSRVPAQVGVVHPAALKTWRKSFKRVSRIKEQIEQVSESTGEGKIWNSAN